MVVRHSCCVDSLLPTLTQIQGIARQFKQAFPFNYKKYKEACEKGELVTGKLLVVKDSNLLTSEKTKFRLIRYLIYLQASLAKLIKRLLNTAGNHFIIVFLQVSSGHFLCFVPHRLLDDTYSNFLVL
jgi:hypothetical protein